MGNLSVSSGGGPGGCATDSVQFDIGGGPFNILYTEQVYLHF